MIKKQPTTSIFFKSFLELDGTNMVNILAFDSTSMQLLLDNENISNFKYDFPIFYKNRIQKIDDKSKYFYLTAIDIALKNN